MAVPLAVVIRRVRPSDAPALQRFYAELSPASRRARFLGTCAGLSEHQTRSFCTPDHSHAEGFVATAGAGAGRSEQIVGHLCLEPVTDRRVELAVAVADEWQRRGIGRRLFEAALAWAGQHRCTEIVASAYADNGSVLRLLSSGQYDCTIRGPEAGVVTVTIPLRAPVPLPWQSVPPAARRRRAARCQTPCHAIWRRAP